MKNEFRLYSSNMAPGINMLMVVISVSEDDKGNIKIKWYYINSGFVSGYKIWAGDCFYSKEIFPNNFDEIFNFMIKYIWAEILNQIIFPKVKSNPSVYELYAILNFKIHNIDKAWLIIFDKIYSEGINKICETIKCETIKNDEFIEFLSKVRAVTCNPSQIIYSKET